MNPYSENSAWHWQLPVLHDFQYHLVDGVPVLGDAPEDSE